MRTNRPYVQIDPDVLERVRQIDLLSYLREFEPSNLVKVKGTSNVYCTAEHDSLKISNGKWYWWSRGFGGYSALDYLIKVKEYDFVEAVGILTGQALADWKPPPSAEKKDEPKVLLLPPKFKNCEIWDVGGRLDHPIDYAENPEKTVNPKYTEADLQAMVDVMEYATNKDKTEQRFFVTGVNCDPTTARDEMMIVHRGQWNYTNSKNTFQKKD